MHYNAIKKAMALALGGTLCAGLIVAPGVIMLDLDKAQPMIVGHLTLDQWHAHRAAHVNEDEAGWDCRLDGNMECGGADSAAYALSCTTYAVTTSLCALERHPFGG